MDDTWQRLRDSKISVADVWHGYRENIRHLLDEVDVLLIDIDDNRVVVNLNHGNGIGEQITYDI